MSATEDQGALEKRDKLLRQLDQTRMRIRAGDRSHYNDELAAALQAYNDSVGFEVKCFKPHSISELASVTFLVGISRFFPENFPQNQNNLLY